MRRSREVIEWRVFVVVREEMGWSKRYVFAMTSGTSSEKEFHTVLKIRIRIAVSKRGVRVVFLIFVERFVEFHCCYTISLGLSYTNSGGIV